MCLLCAQHAIEIGNTVAILDSRQLNRPVCTVGCFGEKDDFFLAFGEQVAPGGVEPVTSGKGAVRYERSGRWTIWVIMFVVLLLALLFAF